MSVIASLIVKIGADIADLKTNLEKVNESLDKVGVSFTKLVTAQITADAATGVLKSSFGAMVGAIDSSIRAAAEAEKAHTQLVTALKAQGNATPDVVKAYTDYASALQRTTIFQDDAIESAAVLLTTIGNVMPRDMQKALQATTDLASVMGGDLNGAAMKVAQAAEGNVKGLKKLVGGFDESRLSAEGFSYVLEKIEEKFGGQGAALAATYEGRLKQLGNTWNNVEESVGRAITTNATVLGVMAQINEAIDGNTGELSENKTVTELVSTAVIGLVRVFAALAPMVGAIGYGVAALPIAFYGLSNAAINVSAVLDQFFIAFLKGVQTVTRVDMSAPIKSLQTDLDELKIRYEKNGQAAGGVLDATASVAKALDTAGAMAEQMANKLESTRGKTVAVSDSLQTGAGNWDKHTQAVGKGKDAIVEFTKTLSKLDQEMKGATAHGLSTQDVMSRWGGELDKVTIEAKALGVSLPESIRKWETAVNNAKITEEMAKWTAKATETLNKLNEETESKLQKRTQILADSLIKATGLESDYQEKLIALVSYGLAGQLNTIERERAKQIAALGKAPAGMEAAWQKSITAINAYFDQLAIDASGLGDDIARTMDQQGVHTAAVMQDSADVAREQYERMADSGLYTAEQVSEAWERAYELQQKASGNACDKVVNDLKKIADAVGVIGNEIGGAAGDVVTHIGSIIGALGTAQKSTETFGKGMDKLGDGDTLGGIADITQGVGGMVSAFNGATNSSSKLMNTLGGAAVGAQIGAQFGAIGAAVGAVVGGIGGLIKSLFNNPEKQINPIREAFVQAAGGLGALNEKAHEAGITLDHLLNAKNPEQYKAAIDELNNAFAFQDQAASTLDATISKYGFSIEELGPKFKAQKLDEMAQGLYSDYQVLIAGGIENATVIDRMSGAINDYVGKALKAGAEIPASMRPMIEKAIEMGELTDANGNKITDLAGSGITFSETMTTGFQKVVDAVGKLAESIARKFGTAFDSAATAANGAINAIPRNINVGVHFRGDGGDVTDGVPQMADGGIVTQPTLAIIGEAGPEAVVPLPGSRGYKPLSGGSSGGGAGLASGGEQTIVIMLDGRQIAATTVKHMPGVLRLNGISA
jgi:hypothetical protein